jgi:transcriptional regulator with XRE-family HTH domain
MPRRTLVDPRFPDRLRELRQARGLSYRALARLVPCSHVHVWELEQGRKVPSPELVASLDHVFPRTVS